MRRKKIGLNGAYCVITMIPKYIQKLIDTACVPIRHNYLTIKTAATSIAEKRFFACSRIFLELSPSLPPLSHSPQSDLTIGMEIFL